MIEARIEDLERSGKSKSYVKANQGFLDHLESQLGDVSVQSVTKGQIRRLLNDEADRLKAKGKTNYMVNQMRAAYKSFSNWCIDYIDIEMKSPCRALLLIRCRSSTNTSRRIGMSLN